MHCCVSNSFIKLLQIYQQSEHKWKVEVERKLKERSFKNTDPKKSPSQPTVIITISNGIKETFSAVSSSPRLESNYFS